MKEHLDVPIDTSNMSEQELQFHYFKMHDADNNNKLDGCELIKSLIHWHGEFIMNFFLTIPTIYLCFGSVYRFVLRAWNEKNNQHNSRVLTLKFWVL
jgi:hypothetical protein